MFYDIAWHKTFIWQSCSSSIIIVQHSVIVYNASEESLSTSCILTTSTLVMLKINNNFLSLSVNVEDYTLIQHSHQMLPYRWCLYTSCNPYFISCDHIYTRWWLMGKCTLPITAFLNTLTTFILYYSNTTALSGCLKFT